MSDQKISELNPAGAIDGSELVPVVQGTGTVKATLTDVFNALRGAGYDDTAIQAAITALQAADTTTDGDVTALQTAITALQAADTTINGNVATLRTDVNDLQGLFSVYDNAGNQRGWIQFVEATGDLEILLTDATGQEDGMIRIKPDNTIEVPYAPATASGTKTLITNEMLAAKLLGLLRTSPATGNSQEIVVNAPGDIPLVLRGTGGQTANLFEVKNAAGNVLFKIEPDGSITIGGDANFPGNVHINGSLTAAVAGTMIYKGKIDLTVPYAPIPNLASGWYYTVSTGGAIDPSWNTHLEANVPQMGVGDVLIYDGVNFIHLSNTVTPSPEPVQVLATGYTTDVTVEDGAGYFHVSPALHGKQLVTIHAAVITAGTGGPTSIQIHNLTQGNDMLTTQLTIDDGETGSDTAATAGVIGPVNSFVSDNDMLRIDVKAVSPTTAPQGLLVTMEFN